MTASSDKDHKEKEKEKAKETAADKATAPHPKKENEPVVSPYVEDHKGAILPGASQPGQVPPSVQGTSQDPTRK